MAGTFTPGDLSFNGREIMELSESIFEAVFELPALNEFHEVETGIKAKQQIAIAGLLGMVGTKASGDCTTAVDANGIPYTEKTWDPVEIDVRITQCWKDMIPSFHAWAANNGIEKYDLSGSDWLNFVMERLEFSLMEAVYRHAWFGDTAADNVSGAGNITDGVDLDYFNAIDGFWKQIYAIGTATPARRITIAENSGATYVLQELTAGSSVTILRGLNNKADVRLRGKPLTDRVYICTQSIIDNYADYLESQGVAPSFERLESGFEVLKYRNVMLIPFDFWDRTIAESYDTTVVTFRPHRAVHTVATNLRIGLENESAFTDMLVWYEKKEKTNYIDVSFSIDAKIPEDYLIQAAY